MGNLTDSTVLKTEGVGDTYDQMPSFALQSREGGTNTDALPLKMPECKWRVVCLCFFLLRPPTKPCYCDVMMHALYFWSREKSKTIRQESLRKRGNGPSAIE